MGFEIDLPSCLSRNSLWCWRALTPTQAPPPPTHTHTRTRVYLHNLNPRALFLNMLVSRWGAIKSMPDPQIAGQSRFGCLWQLVRYIPSWNIWSPAITSVTQGRVMPWWLCAIYQIISNCSNVFTSTLLLSEGQAGEPWEPSNKTMLFLPLQWSACYVCPPPTIRIKKKWNLRNNTC
jgi:hypothetical protein